MSVIALMVQACLGKEPGIAVRCTDGDGCLEMRHGAPLLSASGRCTAKGVVYACQKHLADELFAAPPLSGARDELADSGGIVVVKMGGSGQQSEFRTVGVGLEGFQGDPG